MYDHISPPIKPDPVADDSETRYPKVTELVRIGAHPICKTILVVVWLGMALGGLAVISSFIGELKSEVPPVEGTPSYDAQHRMAELFPSTPLSLAVLVSTTDGRQLVDYVQKDTGGGLVNSTVCPTLEQCVLGGGKLQDCVKGFISPHGCSIGPTPPKKLCDFPLPPEPALINVERCPQDTSLTPTWRKLENKINETLYARFGPQSSYKCKIGLISLLSLPKLGPVSLKTPLGSVSVTVPSEELWWQFHQNFLESRNKDPKKNYRVGLTGISIQYCNNDSTSSVDPVSQTALDVSNALQDIDTSPDFSEEFKGLSMEVSSQRLMIDSIKEGIHQTMDLSSATLPIALLILAGMLRNLRLILCTILNLSACVAAAILVMYPIAKQTQVSTTAPSLMIAVSLAMSIDYSLFLLSRFQKEKAEGRHVQAAVVVMLATSGKIVLVSGATLMLCFLMMLSLPVQLISTMGISAAVTVFMAVTVALTLTPTLILSFPGFFSSSRRWGFTFDGCCGMGCLGTTEGNGAPGEQSEADELHMDMLREQHMQEKANSNQEAENAYVEESLWKGFGNFLQQYAWVVLVVLFAIAIPFGLFSLPRFDHTTGLVQLMPRTSDPYKTVQDLQSAFGVGAIFPTTLLLVPHKPMTNASDRSDWLREAYTALTGVANATNGGNGPAFTMDAFQGAMVLGGVNLANIPPTGVSIAAGPAGDTFWNKEYTATKVSVQYQIDPFSNDGQDWIKRLRDSTSTPAAKLVADWYVSGEGPNQMDVANKTFDKIPVMIALMMCVVLVLIGVAFRSLVAPIRAVVCLLWMLVITFGMAVFTFQDGWLDFLGAPQMQKRSMGAMYWMSPCIAFSVVVGLGLDYDIFYSERVVEEREKGYTDKEAAVRALCFTANIISAAGVIMVVAFCSLLASSTPTLNEIAFLLILGILIDCFVNTKVIIPSVIALMNGYNFWPRDFGFGEQAPNMDMTSPFGTPSQMEGLRLGGKTFEVPSDERPDSPTL